MKNKSKKLESVEYTKKERFLMAALTSLGVTFTYFFYGPIDIYSNNMAEFAVTFKDIFPLITAVFLISFAVMTSLLFLLKSHVMNIVTAMIMSLFISGVIDNNITNRVVYTSGDASPITRKGTVIFFATYIIFAYAMAFLALFLKYKWKNVLIFLCVLLFGTNAAALAGDFFTKDLIHDNDINCRYVISNDGLYEASDKENIILIVFDRMDTMYYDAVVKKYPEYFNNMKGFTYYDSATSSYSRTFPAVSSLISDNLYLNDIPPEEYFATTYKNSHFLKDLRNNGYNIRTYIDRYYEYSDAESMQGIIDNVEPVTGYKVDKLTTLLYFDKLSVDRNFSYILTSSKYSNATSGATSKLSQLMCENGLFHDNDAKFYKELTQNGLSPSGNDKDFIFLYLHGSHTPIILNEDCEESENATIESQTIGAFKIVFEYLEQLKKLGVYDNSTIIITADHGYAISDTDDYFQVSNTGITSCMFVKPRGAKNEKLITSSKEISITNLVPTIVQDAKLKTDYKYNKSVFDIKEGEHVRRTLYQSVFSNKHKLVLNEYEIYGDAKDLKNWKLKQVIKSDFAWY